MITIQNIGSYIPKGRQSNFDRKEKFGIDDAFINEKLGVLEVSQKSKDEETSDMCVKAFNALQKKVNKDLSDIDCLIVCTQNPDGNGIPHTSAVVQGKLGIEDQCACFDISLGCSGYVYSLSVIQAFMHSNNFKKGLLFTADPYSKIVNQDDKNTSLLFGDGATVTLLEESEDCPGLRADNFVFSTRGSEGEFLNNNDEKLVMNGWAVYSFSMNEVPNQLEDLLAKSGKAKKDIDLFLFHQGSKYMVNMLAKRLDIVQEKAPVDIENCGNTVSSSIPLMLEKYLENQEIKTFALCGFGVGLSWASCLLTRK